MAIEEYNAYYRNTLMPEKLGLGDIEAIEVYRHRRGLGKGVIAGLSHAAVSH